MAPGICNVKPAARDLEAYLQREIPNRWDAQIVWVTRLQQMSKARPYADHHLDILAVVKRRLIRRYRAAQEPAP